ncbi:MAG TPA: four helix bundle protein [Phycisphaerales bacterium]|nr:four helix bundle protein [Phycisphaerales bacterium]
MTPAEMKARTQKFALRVIRCVESLPKNRASEILGRQLLRASTSVGANYRAACRSRSDADFQARMGIVEEEVDETLYWMELLVQAKLVKIIRLEKLMQEAEELLRIVVASIKTVKNRVRKPRTV